VCAKSESPAKGGQIVVHPAAAARTIPWHNWPVVFIIFVFLLFWLSCVCGIHAAEIQSYNNNAIMESWNGKKNKFKFVLSIYDSEVSWCEKN
jgi:hypothetical protein